MNECVLKRLQAEPSCQDPFLNHVDIHSLIFLVVANILYD